MGIKINNKNYTVAFVTGETAHNAAKLLANEVADNSYYIKSIFPFKNSKYKIIGNMINSFLKIFTIPNHDIYFINSPVGIFFAFLKKNILRSKSIFINRLNDSFVGDDQFSNIKKNLLIYVYKKSINGTIAVSDMIKLNLNKYIPNIFTKVFYSPLQDNSLLDLNPNLKSKNIISIGIKGRDRKGTSISIKVAKNLVEVNTFFLGNYKSMKNLYNENKNIDNIKFEGRKDPKKYFKKSLFILHPARFDAGPNVILEAMSSGLIPIISHKTGRIKMVSELRNDLVIHSFNYKDYLSKIKELMKLSNKELLMLSKKSKKIAEKYQNKYTYNEFKKIFKEVVIKCQEKQV